MLYIHRFPPKIAWGKFFQRNNVDCVGSAHHSTAKGTGDAIKQGGKTWTDRSRWVVGGGICERMLTFTEEMRGGATRAIPEHPEGRPRQNTAPCAVLTRLRSRARPLLLDTRSRWRRPLRCHHQWVVLVSYRRSVLVPDDQEVWWPSFCASRPGRLTLVWNVFGPFSLWVIYSTVVRFLYVVNKCWSPYLLPLHRLTFYSNVGIF